MSSEPNLREATASDIPALAALCGQLGYPSTPEQLAARLTRLAGPEDCVLVAEMAGKVVGWIHVRGVCCVESDPNAEIAGLVVDESCRGAGVGSELVEAACRWATQHGYGEVRVRSNVIREQAHRFYERQGFRRLKTQIAFARRL